MGPDRPTNCRTFRRRARAPRCPSMPLAPAALRIAGHAPRTAAAHAVSGTGHADPTADSRAPSVAPTLPVLPTEPLVAPPSPAPPSVRRPGARDPLAGPPTLRRCTRPGRPTSPTDEATWRSAGRDAEPVRRSATTVMLPHDSCGPKRREGGAATHDSDGSRPSCCSRLRWWPGGACLERSRTRPAMAAPASRSGARCRGRGCSQPRGPAASVERRWRSRGPVETRPQGSPSLAAMALSHPAMTHPHPATASPDRIRCRPIGGPPPPSPTHPSFGPCCTPCGSTTVGREVSRSPRCHDLRPRRRRLRRIHRRRRERRDGVRGPPRSGGTGSVPTVSAAVFSGARRVSTRAGHPARGSARRADVLPLPPRPFATLVAEQAGPGSASTEPTSPATSTPSTSTPSKPPIPKRKRHGAGCGRAPTRIAAT